MLNAPAPKILNSLPRLYQTDDTLVADKIIYLHF